MSDESELSKRVSSFQRVVEERVANSFFRLLLRSRFHWPVSNWFSLLTYAGRRTGRQFTFPVAYKRIDESIIVVTPMKDSNWWKNFQESKQCTVCFRGTERSAMGELVAEEERGTLIVRYFDTFGILGRILGFGGDPAASPDQLAQAKQSLAVVRFTLSNNK